MYHSWASPKHFNISRDRLLCICVCVCVCVRYKDDYAMFLFFVLPWNKFQLFKITKGGNLNHLTVASPGLGCNRLTVSACWKHAWDGHSVVQHWYKLMIPDSWRHPQALKCREPACSALLGRDSLSPEGGSKPLLLLASAVTVSPAKSEGSQVTHLFYVMP